MRDARYVVVVVMGLSGVLLGSCKTDLGECDETMLGGSNVLGSAMVNAGQIVVNKTCAGGRCHDSLAKGDNRVGVPAGLNFDVVSPNIVQGDTPMTKPVEYAHINKAAKVVKDHAEEMWEEIEDGEMPPKNQMRELNSADKETLRNWLACGAPVIFAPIGGAGGTDYDSIYKGLTDQGCLACHGGTADAGGGFMIGMTACESYKNVFMKPAVTTIGQPPCASSGMQLVVPNAPDMSLLLKKVEGTQTCGAAMPLGTSGLGASNPTVMALRQWIMAGAPAPMNCTP